MPLTVDNCKVVYLRLITIRGWKAIDIIQLGAKFEGKKLSVWIELQTKMYKEFSKGGYEYRDGAWFFRGQRLSEKTVPLEVALTEFHKLIASSHEPVLLVTHSSTEVMRSLFEAIQVFEMVDSFRGVIERITNTLPIFKQKFPHMIGKSDFTLKTLINSVLHTSTKDKFWDSQFYLTCLEKMIAKSSISTSELIKNSESYEEVIASLVGTRSWVDVKRGVLKKFMSDDTIQRLQKSKSSYAILKDLSRQNKYPQFYQYLNKNYIQNVNRKVVPRIAGLLFDFFAEKNQRDNEYYSSSSSDLEEVNAESPSLMPVPVARYSNDHSANKRRKQVVSDEIISLIEDEEVPRYNDSHSFNRQQEELNAAGPSHISDAPVRYNNDYPPTRGWQQELPYDIHLPVEQLATENNSTNYSPIRGQEELVRDIERQGELYDNDYQFTGEHNELASFWEREAQIERRNNDYLLTKGRQQELPYDIHLPVEELATNNNSTNYPPIRGQEELVRNIERQGELYNTGEHNELGSSWEREAQIAQRNNDYLLTRGRQQELPHDIDSLVEELATEYSTDYPPIREQEEILHDIAPSTNDHPLTRHQEERNADIDPSMGEWYLPINQDQPDQDFDYFHYRIDRQL